MGVAAACAALLAAGCGGAPTLETGEVETVTQARAAVKSAVAAGSLDAAGQRKVEQLMILCHQKPLAEEGGDSVREIIKEIAPGLKGVADPAFAERIKRQADHGCD